MALDISEAEFSTFMTIPGIPASKIVRNPDFHFILSKEVSQKIAGDFQNFGIWAIAAEDLLGSGIDEMVVVIPAKGKSSVRDKEEADKLREQGLLA